MNISRIYFTMNMIEIILIAVSLSTDAFAVAVSKGLSVKKLANKNILIVGLYFGVFQALMPYIGFHIAFIFGKYLIRYSHLFAFIILTILGISFILDKDSGEDDDFSITKMLPLAIGTSIDALTVGITFTLMEIDIVSSITIIGIITFVTSCLGVIIGFRLKREFLFKPQKLGGIILILLGIKMLFEALF